MQAQRLQIFVWLIKLNSSLTFSCERKLEMSVVVAWAIIVGFLVAGAGSIAVVYSAKGSRWAKVGWTMTVISIGIILLLSLNSALEVAGV